MSILPYLKFFPSSATDRNDCVFNGATPRLSTTLNLAQEEAVLWSLVGAKGLSLHTTWDGG